VGQQGARKTHERVKSDQGKPRLQCRIAGEGMQRVTLEGTGGDQLQIKNQKNPTARKGFAALAGTKVTLHYTRRCHRLGRAVKVRKSS